MQTLNIDANMIILAIIAAIPIMFKAWLQRNDVPAKAAQAMADSVPSEVANKMADCLPPSSNGASQ